MTGRVPDITQISSPNFGPRRHGLPPDMVVLHYTAMATAQAACERLCDEAAEVSAHYVISETGDITQLVTEDMRAWHAGGGAWGDVTDVNSHSIGIELANASGPSDLRPFPNAQMDALEAVLAGVQRRWAIPAARIIGHSDMAPDRKFDPGPKFDWQRLAFGKLSVWVDRVEDVGGTWGDFEIYATAFGYRAPTPDAQGWAHVLSAFRMRFLPHKTGDLDGIDIGVIKRLAKEWPCADVDVGTANA
jgi:N-acetylmuramoyl-L-alanine amidase